MNKSKEGALSNHFKTRALSRMNQGKLLLTLLSWGMLACQNAPQTQESQVEATYADIKMVGAMKNVMWKGELEGRINLDTISDRNGLYGVGPEQYLEGELMIVDGTSYVSRVTSDSTMYLEETYAVSAPFFVYGHVREWQSIVLPDEVKTLQDLEAFIDENTKDYKRPFAFQLRGLVSSALVHVQNLPQGATVSSPEEAHQGQVTFPVEQEQAHIVGFFSTEHQGVFTHHDSYLHMHLMTVDRPIMGHLDDLVIAEMTLLLPVL
jgi:acetolactate decarboxylase